MTANRALLATSAGAGVAGLIGIKLSPLPASDRSFLIGFALALVLLGLVYVVHVAAGTHARLLGAQAERYTASAACGWRRRRAGWRIVHGLRYQWRGDVDHVLIGPGGIYAIETKWTSEPWAVEGGRLVSRRHRCPLHQAREGAAKVGLQLRFGRERVESAVVPVVVIWGPGAPDLPEPLLLDGVVVLEGRRHRHWGDVFSRDRLDPEVVDAAHRALVDHQVAQRRWEDGRPARLAT